MSPSLTKNWKFLGSCVDSQYFEIGGLNIWDYDWKPMNLPDVVVKDPQYNNDYEFSVYEINSNGKKFIFAAGEFSNCFWGFYVPESKSI